MLSVKGGKDVFGMMKGIYDLELLEAFCPLEQRQDRALNNEIIEVQFKEFPG